MLSNILKIDQIRSSDIMIPRADIGAVEVNDNFNKVLEVFIKELGDITKATIFTPVENMVGTSMNLLEKDKIELIDDKFIENKLLEIKNKFRSNKITNIDGLKIDFEDSWIHLRKSNTEPLIRIYAESNSRMKSKRLIDKFKNHFSS